MTDLPSLDVVRAKLVAAGVEIPEGNLRLDGYGDSAELSAELIALIVAGRKRAGTGLVWAYEADGEALPQAGDVEIVLDHENEPVLVTRTTRVEIVPFDAVTAEYAAIEGEGDGSLGYWRRGHWAFFSRECARIGREPAPDMPVACCVFELVATIPARGSRGGNGT
ncbi:MAG: ASCH domain-containing protein [bacterium]